MLAVNINLVAFSAFLGDLTGQVFAMFVLTVAAGEAAIGLAILVIYFRSRGTIAVERGKPMLMRPPRGGSRGHSAIDVPGSQVGLLPAHRPGPDRAQTLEATRQILARGTPARPPQFQLGPLGDDAERVLEQRAPLERRDRSPLNEGDL